MFSKPLYINEEELVNRFINDNIKPPMKLPKKIANSENLPLSFTEYFKQNIVLKKYKLIQLKQIAKANKLHVSGSKDIIINRIHTYFDTTMKCIRIQTQFRGHMVRRCFSMRGDGYRCRKLCVNENDFYSMEPLHEIPYEYFFTFKSNDEKFIFGCNIVSLLHLINNKPVVKNPYNREIINISIIKDILKLYNILKILYGKPEDAPQINTIAIMAMHNNNINNINNINNSINSINNLNAISNNNIMMRGRNRHTRDPITTPPTHFVLSDEIVNERSVKLHAMRSKPQMIRIQELFMEIDQLGNYTNYHWFLDLERREFVRLYRTLYDIWSYRGHLSREMKYKICAVEDPFQEIHRERVYLNDAPIERLREICLKIFEHLVYCGIDEEHRKIGTLHALSALTIVSNSARDSMPWLYESLYP